MFQSLVITLREGVEAALILGIVLGYLKKTGRQAWSRYAWWGLIAAIAASLAAAYVIHRFEVIEDAYEGWLMLVGAFLVATMVYWMWRTGKRLKHEIESRLSELSASPSRSAAFGLFLFVFLMVFREGVGDRPVSRRGFPAHQRVAELPRRHTGLGARGSPGRGLLQGQRESQPGEVLRDHEPWCCLSSRRNCWCRACTNSRKPRCCPSSRARDGAGRPHRQQRRLFLCGHRGPGAFPHHRPAPPGG